MVSEVLMHCHLAALSWTKMRMNFTEVGICVVEAVCLVADAKQRERRKATSGHTLGDLLPPTRLYLRIMLSKHESSFH
jgi:hypothetical protein